MAMQKVLNVTKHLSLLYVEDEETSREQLQDLFAMLFEKVEVACDGQEGLEKYQEGSFDIIITDINMPRMDGLSFIEAVKKINPEQSVIIISAHSDSEKLLQAINFGVDNFIIKPVRMEQLQAVLVKVAEYLQAQRLMQRYQEDLEHAVEQKTAQLMQLVVTDELTGVLNRNALMRQADEKMHRVMLLLNIDNFDSINVTYGYDAGDKVLQEIAKYLSKRIDKDATLYRLGSDEFVVLSYSKTLQEMEHFAKSLQKQTATDSLQVGDFEVKFSFTMALAEGEECLLKKARIALKDAHSIGKNRIAIYNSNSAVELLQLRIQEYMPKLRKIIAQRYIVPYFQAIVNNATGKVEKYECLARVVDEHKNIQSPVEFIDVAELTGMIVDITKIMIDKSFQIFAENSYEFSINISENDLSEGYLREYLAEKTQQYKIEPSRVVLEVLEGISASGAKESLTQLMELKEDGYAIAIDDFGVQNSNFERVHAMQVDYIKIDGSFIKNILADEKSFNVAKTIHDFAKSVGAKVVAEYVHSKEVQDVVQKLGIEYSQGYYFSEPKPTLA